ncbi:MAG TPA: MFS transporter, partial [Candidatus Eisenbacteria bacterium]|nr:MFS transporter [Candidatus Eisenbacteria bacterium]
AAGARPRLFTPSFATLSAAVLAFFISNGMFLPVIPRYTAGPLGGSDVAVGIVLGSFSITSLLTRPIAGRLADRRGRRVVLLAGAIVAVAASFGHLVAADLATLIAMRLLLGVGEALFFVAGMAAATDLAPEERRGEAISLFSLSLYLGVAIGPVLGELLLRPLGYSAVWLVAGGIAVLAAVISVFAPETLPAGSRATAATGARLVDSRGIEPGLIVLCGVFGMGGYFAFMPLLGDRLGLDGVGGYMAAFALVVVVLRIVGARLPDRLGAARLSGAAMVVTAIGLAIAGFFPTAIGLAVATVIFASGVAFTFPAIMALSVIGVTPGQRGAVMGTASLFVDVAFGLSPAVLGLLATVTGYPATFLVSGVIAAIGAAWLLIRRPGAARLSAVGEPG